MTSTQHVKTPARFLVSLFAALVAGVFVVVGVLGFIPAATTGYDTMTLAGYRSDAMLFGVFQVSVLHNLVHVALGIVGLAMARSAVGARVYLIGGGIACLALWIYGLMIDQGSAQNILPVNTADNWLHFLLGVVMVGLALSAPKRSGH